MGSMGGAPRTYGLHRNFDKEKPKDPVNRERTTLRRIMSYFRPHAWSWLVVVICILISSGLSVLPPFLIAGIVDIALPEQRPRLLFYLAGGMVALAVISGLIGVLQQTLMAKVGQGILHDLRIRLFTHLQQMPLAFFMTNRSGEILSRLNNDVNAAQGVATGTLVGIVSNLAVLITTSAALLYMNPWLTLLAVAVVPAFHLPSMIVGKIRRRLSARTQEEKAALMGFMGERLHVAGITLTRIFGQREPDEEAFVRHSRKVCELQVQQSVVGRWLFMILSTFSALGPALIFWVGGRQVMAGELSVGQLIAFATLLGQLYRPLMQLATVYVDIQGAFAVFDRIFEYLDLTPGLPLPEHPLSPERIEGRMVFEQVVFEYPTAAPPGRETASESDAPALRPALRGLNLQIEPGQRVALVGRSGAGKSTLTLLVPRFYDPTEGRVTLDGIDLREYDPEAMRRHIGMVTQETFLFHDTLRMNLLYARPDATEEQMIAACKAAHVHEFIAGLPDGYDTLVGERGFRLSGGEKQRVSIARALLKDPAILILDEATSSLDATSESLVQEALETLLRGRTSLVIAHRLSTVLGADQIVVMDEGRVEDSGTHAELMTRDGLYRELFEQQFRHVLSTHS
jgi:ATP-binding cassette subfamily B protein